MIGSLYLQGARDYYGGAIFELVDMKSPFFPSFERLDASGDYEPSNNVLIFKGFNGGTGKRAAYSKRRGLSDEIVAEQAALNRAPMNWWRKLCGFSTPGLAEHVETQIAKDFAYVQERMTPEMRTRFLREDTKKVTWTLMAANIVNM